MGPHESDLASLSDDQVIKRAQHLYRRLQTVPRWSDENEPLVRDWGLVCMEMGRRGITDTVTESGPVEVWQR